MSDFKKVIGDVIGWIHGKKPATLGADSKKLLDDVEGVGAGLYAAGPYAPTIVGDSIRLGAELSALVASRGLDVAGYAQAATDLTALARALADAEKAFVTQYDRFRQVAGIVAIGSDESVAAAPQLK